MPDIRKLKDRAAELMTKRRFDKAAESYAKLCQLEPSDLGLRQRLGDAQRLAGRKRDAVLTYQSVADRFAREGLLLKAIAVNKVILELDPSHTATQETLALLYAQRQGRAPTPPPRAEPAPAAPAEISVELPEADELGEAEVERPGASSADLPAAEVVEPDRRLTALDDVATGPELEFEIEDGDDEPDEAELVLEPEPEPDEVAPPRPSEGVAEVHELSLDLDAEMDRQMAMLESEPTAAAPPSGAADSIQPDRLPPIPLFSDLEPFAFVDLLQRCTLLRRAAGEAIVRQGEPGRSFFVVSSGTVRVRRTEPSGEVIELARLHEGAFFGEMALLSDGPRTASVVAEGDVELLEFPAEVLRALIVGHPSARVAVEKFTRNRLLGSVMATSPLFRPFDAENRKQLVERFLVREVAPGEVVLTAGQPGDGLYVVMQGRFQVLRPDPSGGPSVLLSELREGDVFGEISLLTRSAATADVQAVGAGRLLRLPRQAFDEVILTHPQILELVSRLSEERQQATEAVLGGKVACDTEGLMLL